MQQTTFKNYRVYIPDLIEEMPELNFDALLSFALARRIECIFDVNPAFFKRHVNITSFNLFVIEAFGLSRCQKAFDALIKCNYLDKFYNFFKTLDMSPDIVTPADIYFFYKYLFKKYEGYFVPELPADLIELAAKMLVTDRRQGTTFYDPSAGAGSFLFKFLEFCPGISSAYVQSTDLRALAVLRVNSLLSDVNLISYSCLGLPFCGEILDPYPDQTFNYIFCYPPRGGYSFKVVGRFEKFINCPHSIAYSCNGFFTRDNARLYL